MNVITSNKHNNCSVYMIDRPFGTAFNIALECSNCVVLKGKRKGKPEHIQWVSKTDVPNLLNIGVEYRNEFEWCR